MTDGLEISEIQFQNVDKEKIRIDSEYYSKQNLYTQFVVDAYSGRTIKEHNGIMDCSAFYPSITGCYNNDHKGVPFLRVNEISNGLVSIR